MRATLEENQQDLWPGWARGEEEQHQRREKGCLKRAEQAQACFRQNTLPSSVQAQQHQSLASSHCFLISTLIHSTAGTGAHRAPGPPTCLLSPRVPTRCSPVTSELSLDTALPSLSLGLSEPWGALYTVVSA